LALGEVATAADGAIVIIQPNEPLTKINNADLIRADILASNGIIQEIDTVLMTVAPPPPPPPDDLIDNVESWIPYIPGESLPIGDAELVPGEPIMRESVEILRGLLLESGANINIARAVRLGELDEVTHLAPVGPQDAERLQEEAALQSENELVIGVLRMEGEIERDYGEGPFLIYSVTIDQASDFNCDLEGKEYGENLILLIDSERDCAKVLDGLPEEEMDIDDAPSAGIYFGTRVCKYWGRNWFTGQPYHVCYPCFWGSEGSC
jgi:hypothetical protein